MLTFQNLGRYGRFANGMFQIASTIGIAIKNGYDYSFPEWINHDHKDRFGSTEDCDLQKYFVNPLPKLTEGVTYPDFPVSWGYHEGMSVPDNVSISGHLQSEKYFSHCLPIIQHYFRMKNETPIYDACAIHIRLGDYDDAYHPRQKREYYQKAMEQFPSDQSFTVFTDDREQASRIVDLSGQVLLSPGADYIEDFRIMKRFKHFITGNSSYSIMSAILGEHPDKKIVCPSNWFGPAWNGHEKSMARDIYPQNSIVI